MVYFLSTSSCELTLQLQTRFRHLGRVGECDLRAMLDCVLAKEKYEHTAMQAASPPKTKVSAVDNGRDC